MQALQSYILTINNLFVISGGMICGAQAEVAILDGKTEIDRLSFSGKIGAWADRRIGVWPRRD